MPVMNHLSQKYTTTADYMGVDSSDKFLNLIMNSSSNLYNEEDGFEDLDNELRAIERPASKLKEENKENSQEE